MRFASFFVAATVVTATAIAAYGQTDMPLVASVDTGNVHTNAEDSRLEQLTEQVANQSKEIHNQSKAISIVYRNTSSAIGEATNRLKAVEGRVAELEFFKLPGSQGKGGGTGNAGRGRKITEWIAVGGALVAALMSLIAVLSAMSGKKTIKGNMEKLKEKEDNLQKLLESIEDKAQKIESQSDAVRKQSGTMATNSTEFQEKASTCKTSMEKFIEQLNKGASDVGKALDRIKDAEAQVRKLTYALSGDASGKTPQSLVESFEGRLNSLTAALDAVTDSNNNLQDLNRTMDKGLASVQNFEAAVKERETAIASEIAKASELEYKRGLADGEAKARKDLDENNAEMNKLLGQIEAKNATLDELRKENSEKDVAYGDMKSKLESERDAAKTETKKAQDNLKDVEEQLAAVKSDLEKIRDNARRGFEEKDARINQKDADINRLEAEVLRLAESLERDKAKAREEIRSEIEASAKSEINGLNEALRKAEAERDETRESARQSDAEKDRVIEGLRLDKANTEQELSETKSLLDAEMDARKKERAAAAKELQEEKDGRAADNAECARRIATVEAEREAAKARLFPASLNSVGELKPLIESLDAMDADGIPGAALARASLAVFAEAKTAADRIRLRALGDFSMGIASALVASGKSAVEVATALAEWKVAIEKASAQLPAFSLRLPTIGQRIDISWMHSKVGTTAVRTINSWAVFGSTGNVYMAEVG